MSLADWAPPALIVTALLAYLTGALDRLGLEGAGQGLGIGALICAPIWLAGLWRRSRRERDEAD